MMTMVIDMTAQLAPGIWVLIAALFVAVLSLLRIADVGDTSWR